MAVVGSEQRLALYEATATFSARLGACAAGTGEKWLVRDAQRPRRLPRPRDATLATLSAGCTAEAYFQAQEPQLGLDVLDQAIRFVSDRGSHFWEAEVMRLKGNLLAHVTPHRSEAVEACYPEALAIAQHQQAKSLELRAAAGLARFWRDQGRRDEARDLLAAVHDWFSEGFARRT